MSKTKDIQAEYRKMIDTLNRERDELRVQMNLAGMEARDEWGEMEKKWHQMTSKSKQIGDVVDDTAEEIHELLLELGEEIKQGYQRIKKIL